MSKPCLKACSDCRAKLLQEKWIFPVGIFFRIFPAILFLLHPALTILILKAMEGYYAH